MIACSDSGLGAFVVVPVVELVLADVRRAGEHLVHRIDAEPAAIARPHPTFVQMGRNGLEAHRSCAVSSVERQPIDEPHGFRHGAETTKTQ